MFQEHGVLAPFGLNLKGGMFRPVAWSNVPEYGGVVTEAGRVPPHRIFYDATNMGEVQQGRFGGGGEYPIDVIQ